MKRVNSFTQHKEGTKQLIMDFNGYKVRLTYSKYKDKGPLWVANKIFDVTGNEISSDHPEYRIISAGARAMTKVIGTDFIEPECK